MRFTSFTKSRARRLALLSALAAALGAGGFAAADTGVRGSVRGVDVSHWQGAIDWRAVRSDGIRFAFIKATEGSDLVDPRFARNWRAARRAGVVRGAYHFYRPESSARRQAAHFLATVPIGADDLPPVLDVETIGGSTPAAARLEIRTWLQIVERETGKRPIVYIHPRVAARLDGGLARHALWVAHPRPTAPPVPADWTRWTFWQYSITGRVDGIPRRVDLDRFRGTPEQFASFVESHGHRSH